MDSENSERVGGSMTDLERSLAQAASLPGVTHARPCARPTQGEPAIEETIVVHGDPRPLPDEINGYPLEVFHEDLSPSPPGPRIRPLIAGSQIAPNVFKGGCLGALVWLNGFGCVLTARHVMLNDQNVIGGSGYQPRSNSTRDLVFGPDAVPVFDGGPLLDICAYSTNEERQAGILGVTGSELKSPVDPRLDMPLVKSGPATQVTYGHSHGSVTEAGLFIMFPDSPSTPVALNGDSGALIVTFNSNSSGVREYRPVGILIRGKWDPATKGNYGVGVTCSYITKRADITNWNCPTPSQAPPENG